MQESNEQVTQEEMRDFVYYRAAEVVFYNQASNVLSEKALLIKDFNLDTSLEPEQLTEVLELVELVLKITTVMEFDSTISMADIDYIGSRLGVDFNSLNPETFPHYVQACLNESTEEHKMFKMKSEHFHSRVADKLEQELNQFLQDEK